MKYFTEWTRCDKKETRIELPVGVWVYSIEIKELPPLKYLMIAAHFLAEEYSDATVMKINLPSPYFAALMGNAHFSLREHADFYYRFLVSIKGEGL